ncbi:hypothetical protein FRC12_018106 [Ceratobasidium sp. 428]|nr:hypothetical protein FRC12_018106 [Ceratobasidium sp. 428]
MHCMHLHYRLLPLGISSLPERVNTYVPVEMHGHLFDRRMIGRNLQDEWGAGGRLNESDDLVTCVARFGRDPAKEERDHHPHVTGARMAQTNGHELLLSYSGDAVYQYSIYDTPPTQGKSPILPSNKVASPKRPSSQPGKNQSPKEPTFALDELLAGHMDASSDEEEDEEDISDEDSDSDEMSEDGDETTPAALERPIILPMKDYRGAANVRTVKDVNFLGPNDEFVTSGSDDGNWFLWSKKTGELVGIWEGVLLRTNS